MAVLCYLLLASSITTLSARRANIAGGVVGELGDDDPNVHFANFESHWQGDEVLSADSQIWDLHHSNTSTQHKVVHSHSLLDQYSNATKAARLHQAPVHSQSLLDHSYGSHAEDSASVDSLAYLDAHRGVLGVCTGVLIIVAIGACWWSGMALSTSNATLNEESYKKLVSGGEIGQRKHSTETLEDTTCGHLKWLRGSADKHDAGAMSDDSSGGSLADIFSTGSQHEDEILADLVTTGRLSVLAAQFISAKLSSDDPSDTETVQSQERFEELSQNSEDEGQYELAEEIDQNSKEKGRKQFAKDIDEIQQDVAAQIIQEIAKAR